MAMKATHGGGTWVDELGRQVDSLRNRKDERARHLREHDFVQIGIDSLWGPIHDAGKAVSALRSGRRQNVIPRETVTVQTPPGSSQAPLIGLVKNALLNGDNSGAYSPRRGSENADADIYQRLLSEKPPTPQEYAAVVARPRGQKRNYGIDMATGWQALINKTTGRSNISVSRPDQLRPFAEDLAAYRKSMKSAGLIDDLVLKEKARHDAMRYTPHVLHAPGKSNIHLNDYIVDRVNQLYADIGQITDTSAFFVTDALRNPREQASAMYRNYDKNSAPKYKNKQAASDIYAVYVDGRRRGLARGQTIDNMEFVIKNQIASGVYISRHLYSKGVDLRKPISKSMQDAIRRNKNIQSLQEEGNHWHVQFK